jgi:hypothetical protein
MDWAAISGDGLARHELAKVTVGVNVPEGGAKDLLVAKRGRVVHDVG